MGEMDLLIVELNYRMTRDRLNDAAAACERCGNLFAQRRLKNAVGHLQGEFFSLQMAYFADPAPGEDGPF